MKQKNIQESIFNASLSEVLSQTHRNHQTKNKIKMTYLSFKKGKNIRTECVSGNLNFVLNIKNDLNIEVNQEKNVKERKKPIPNLNQQTN